MRLPSFKRNAGVVRKTLAFLAVAMFSLFSIGLGSSAQAAVSYGINYKIYSGYTGSTGVRPMDNPSVVANYTFCESGTFSSVNTNWGGGNVEGCGADNILIHYTGYLYSATSQTLYFRGYSDDGFYGKVGNTVVVNNWSLQGCGPSSTGAGITFAAGEYKPVDLWFFEQGGGACSYFYYSTSLNGSYSPVPASMFTTSNYQDATFTDTSITSQIPDGVSYSSGVSAAASGTLNYSLFDGALPPGLELDTETGSITGTPNTPGAYTFRIRAQADDEGTVSNDYTGNLTITVGTSVNGGSGLQNQTLWIGESVSDRAVFTGYPTPSVVKGTGDLPPGLTISSNGTVSGAPTVSGSYTFNLRGYNFVNSVTTSSVTYVVKPAPAFINDDGYSVTTTYGSQINLAPEVTGESVTFAIGSGELPNGLSISATSGVVSGKTAESGVFSYRVRATNNSGNVLSQVSTITVRRAPIFTASAISNKLNKGSSYSYDFIADGYPLPTYSVAAGSLPSGMTLNTSTGRVSGTPTTGGNFTFTIRASNSLDTADVSKTVIVNAAPRAVDANLLQEILAGTAYTDGIEYESFPAPLYSVSEGALPPGLTLGTANGTLTGTPTMGGIYSFKLRIIAGENETTTDNYSLTVNQIPTKFDDKIIEKTEIGKIYTDAVVATGFPVPVYRVSAGTLPTGLKLNSSTGAVTGTATATGIFDFTVEATNSVGALAMPLKLAVQSAPLITSSEFPLTLNVGDQVSQQFVATGFPLPKFSLASGSLPEGLSLNPVTGLITGTTTNGGNFSFVIAATNEVGTQKTKSFTVEVIGVKSELAINAQIGDVITGKVIAIESEGLKAAVPYEVILRSTPQSIASGKTSASGGVEEQVKIPPGLEPGWHSITLTSTNSDGTPFEKATYFQVTETLMLEEISEVAPSESQLSEALTNDPEFYERLGLDPAATVTPEAAAAQVEQVTAVVASVALVSAAAAGAAAAASAAGGAASSSSSSGGGARAGGGASSSSSSGGGSNSAGGSEDSEGDSADYGNLEADHDDFETEGAGAVDKLSIWRSSTLTILDKPMTNWIENVAQVSPVLSRVLNDGSYLRALVGSLMGLAYFAAVVLGVAAVDTGASSLATSGKIGLLVLIMAFGTLDALFGIVAMSAFVITSLVAMPVAGIGDIRYLVAMFILGFAPSIMATTFRKIRRPAIENVGEAWERVIDLALIGFISVLTVMSLVGSVSAFTGATVPISNDTRPIAFAIAAVAVGRVVLEELAAKLAPNRLDRLNPTEVPPTFAWQPWASLVLKFATLIVMIGGMVGMGWHLWVGAFLIFLPGIIGMVFPSLPSVKWIHEFIPGGIGALAFATLISAWSGQFVNAWLGKSELYGQLSFILIPLPVILIAIIGMFAKQEEKLWQRSGKKWVGIAGGIAVFVFTIQVTDFIPTIFG